MGGMSDKVNPHNLRVGVIKDWDSKWEPDNSKKGTDKDMENNKFDYKKKAQVENER